MPEPEGGSMSSCSPLYTGYSTSTNELLIILGQGNGVYMLYTHHIPATLCSGSYLVLGLWFGREFANSGSSCAADYAVLHIT